MLDSLLRSGPPHRGELHDFLTAHRGLHGGLPTIEQALLGGAFADRLGFAFVAGYHAALRALLPDAGERPALCITEGGPPHPRTIQTAVADGRLQGTKRFVTAGALADRLWVLASAGWDGDRNRLVLGSVAPDAEGLTMEALPRTPFAPEVPHCVIRFDGTPFDGPLLEDAWSAQVVPFRTLEDHHVLAAATGYVIAAARRSGSPQSEVESLVAVALALRGLGPASATDAATHRALAGIDAQARRVFGRMHLAGVEAARWVRDRPLLDVASGARRARLAAARHQAP